MGALDHSLNEAILLPGRKVPHQSREEIIQSLRGQTIRVPYILPLIQHWPQAQNPNYSNLVPLIDHKLEQVAVEKSKVPRLKQCDFGLFGCLVWPWLDLDKLYVMTCFSIWLFLWDDEIDEDTGSVASDFSAAQRYRSLTLAFVEQSIGLCDHGLTEDQLHPYIGSFSVLGDRIRESYDLEQKQRLMNEIAAFVYATEAEQKIKHADRLWDAETYWHYRVQSSAVGIFSALTEYTMDEKLPRQLFYTKGVKTVWHETNMIISLSNDLFSIKKELPVGGLDSIVPISYASGMEIQAAVDQAVDELRHRIARIDADAKATLDELVSDNKMTNGQRGANGAVVEGNLFAPITGESSKSAIFRKFLQCHQLICTGITVWSYSTVRYGLQSYQRDKDGSIRIGL